MIWINQLRLSARDPASLNLISKDYPVVSIVLCGSGSFACANIGRARWTDCVTLIGHC